MQATLQVFRSMANGNLIPMREFGSSGAKVSAIGCGGHHLGDAEEQNRGVFHGLPEVL